MLDRVKAELPHPPPTVPLCGKGISSRCWFTADMSLPGLRAADWFKASLEK